MKKDRIVLIFKSQVYTMTEELKDEIIAFEKQSKAGTNTLLAVQKDDVVVMLGSTYDTVEELCAVVDDFHNRNYLCYYIAAN